MGKIEVKKAESGPQTDMVLDLANVLKNKTEELRKDLSDKESLSVIALFIPTQITEEDGKKVANANSGIHLDMSYYDKRIIASAFYKMFTDNTEMFEIFELLMEQISDNKEELIIKMLTLKMKALLEQKKRGK